MLQIEVAVSSLTKIVDWSTHWDLFNDIQSQKGGHFTPLSENFVRNDRSWSFDSSRGSAHPLERYKDTGPSCTVSRRDPPDHGGDLVIGDCAGGGVVSW